MLRCVTLGRQQISRMLVAAAATPAIRHAAPNAPQMTPCQSGSPFRWERRSTTESLGPTERHVRVIPQIVAKTALAPAWSCSYYWSNCTNSAIQRYLSAVHTSVSARNTREDLRTNIRLKTSHEIIIFSVIFNFFYQLLSRCFFQSLSILTASFNFPRMLNESLLKTYTSLASWEKKIFYLTQNW